MKKIDVNNRQEVIDAGYKVLTDSLGAVGFAKFMQYINPGKGDYTKWREENLNQNISVRELSRQATEYAKKFKS